jgi:hypothetical protein
LGWSGGPAEDRRTTDAKARKVSFGFREEPGLVQLLGRQPTPKRRGKRKYPVERAFSSIDEMTQSRRPPLMAGVRVEASTRYVVDVQCAATAADSAVSSDALSSVGVVRKPLVSLLNPAHGQQQVLLAGEAGGTFGLILKKDERFVAKIEYPTMEEEDHYLRSQPDSLVTRSLLNLTSYEVDQNINNDNDNLELVDMDSEKERELFATVFRSSDGAQMSFDDLGQIYTNISRKRILSQVMKRYYCG